MRIRTLFWCFAVMWALMIALAFAVWLLSKRVERFEDNIPSWSLPTIENGK